MWPNTVLEDTGSRTGTTKAYETFYNRNNLPVLHCNRRKFQDDDPRPPENIGKGTWTSSLIIYVSFTSHVLI